MQIFNTTLILWWYRKFAFDKIDFSHFFYLFVLDLKINLIESNRKLHERINHLFRWISCWQIPGQRIRQRIRWDTSVGIRRNLSVGFDRALLLISIFHKLVPRANFRGRSKPPTGSVEFQH